MFGPAVTAAIKRHAIAAYPLECCGVVTADGYVPLENVSPEPNDAFDCSEGIEPYVIAGTALAVVHSHTIVPGMRANDWP